MVATQAILTSKRTYKSIYANSKKRVLEQGAHLIAKEADLEDGYDIFSSLVEREKKGSTAIGNGIAIPHCSSEAIDRPMGFFIQLNNGVDFGAADGQDVDLILLLIVPKNECSVFSDVLSEFRNKLLEDGFADKLRDTQDSQELFDLLAENGIN